MKSFIATLSSMFCFVIAYGQMRTNIVVGPENYWGMGISLIVALCTAALVNRLIMEKA